MRTNTRWALSIDRSLLGLTTERQPSILSGHILAPGEQHERAAAASLAHRYVLSPQPGDPFPSRSQRAFCRPGSPEADRLRAEVQLIAVDPVFCNLPWARERFCSRRPRGPALRAFTVDGRGTVVRAFSASDHDLAVYAQHGLGCPLEGVDPLSVLPGAAATPAIVRLEQGVAL